MAEFRWYGHNCFRIKARDATVVTDPVGRATGYAMPKVTADVVTISHQHEGHNNLKAIRADPPYHVIDGPGEYEVRDIFVTGIRTFHDAVKGAERGYNTVYLLELDNIVIGHLGDLGHALSESQLEVLSNADVLLVPAGGDDQAMISPAQAVEIIAQVEPKIVIPMQYATELGDKNLGDLATFCKALGVEPPEPVDKLTIRQSDLGDTVKVMVLSPDSEPARR